MYLSLYRKWRPRVFDEISGQDHITAILKKQCANNRVSHAYLFCGTRGTGKTSSAKILAKAVNCENPINGNPCNVCAACKSIDSGSATDVLEIDAASNNRVDNVRDLRDEVVYPPSVLKKRVYIIDEVHMLTDSAFNALLKTLEEPPEYVVFILATTEINELPPTIISRCIRFDFSRIDAEAVKNRIEFVAKQESIPLAEGSAELLAQLADGSMRDALSLLEACSNGHSGELTTTAIRNVLGLAGEDTIFSLLHAIANKNIPDAIDIITEIHKSSKDVSVFIDDLSLTIRDLIVDKQLVKYGKASKVKVSYVHIAEELTIEQLFYLCSILEETQSRISRYAVNKRIVLEMAVIRMCDRSISDSPKALAARISELEKKIALLSVSGVAPAKITQNTTIVSEAHIEAEPIVEIPSSSERKPFDEISDVYEYLSNNPSLYGFLLQTKTYIENDTVYITGARFALDMIQLEGGDTVINAFTSVIGKTVTVVYEETSESKEDHKQISLIDEL
jgi:DNA polymerase-3 subunit gamma/tau